MEKDSLLLGRIKEIQKYKIIISLPHNKLGTCLISGISEEYNSLLSILVNDDSIMNEVAELNQLFIKGQLVQVKVNNNITNKKIELSMLPSAINSQISMKKLKSGLKLQVAIKSREDKGYILETGIGGLNGFLPFEQCSDSNYQIGKLIEVFPLIDENIKPGKKCRVMNFTMDLKKRGPILCNSIPWDFDSVLPGMLLKTILTLSTDGSLEGKFHGFSVSVKNDHHTITESVSTEQTVTVIGVDLTLKQFDCSLLSHLKPPFKGSEELLAVTVGHSEKNCVVKKKDRNSLVISIPNMKYTTAVVKKSHIEADLKDIEEEASVVLRYLDYNLMDNSIVATTLRKLISQSYFSIHQAKLGEIVKGTVRNFTKAGYSVKISSQLIGLIPIPHLSDKPISNPDKLYQAGATIQCRVFHIDEAENKMLLTTKKSLMTSNLPIVSGFKDFVVDMILDGFVANILEFGLVVILFNNIKGWVPIGRIPESKKKSLKVSYYVGKPVQVKLVRWNAANNKVELSLNNNESVDENEDVNQDNSTVEVGDIYEGIISKLRPGGFNIRLSAINKFAFLPFIHLSDSREHRNLFQAYYNISEKQQIKVSVVVINTNKNKIIVSKKYSLINAAIKTGLLKSSNEITVDSQWHGWIIKKESFGLIVELPSGIRGLIRNKDVCDYKPVTGQASDIFELGDTVSVKVLERDPKQLNRILFTSKMSHTYRAIEHMGVAAIDFLVNHLEERKYLQATDSCKKISGINIGDLVNVIITKQCEWGFTLQLKTDEENENPVAGFIRNQHLPDHFTAENSVQKAVIIDIDLKEQAVEVCMIGSYVNAVSHRKNNCTRIDVNDRISSEVLAYNNDFVVAMLKGHANGNIVYIPTKRYWNDMAKEFLWNIKQKNATVLKKILSNEVFIGSLVINEAINPDDFKDSNKITLYKDLSRKIKVKNGNKYPVYFHSITKTKIFFYLSKLKRGFCNLLDYSASLEELEDFMAHPPERYSLMNKPVKIMLPKHKENGLSTGHFLTKETLEIGDLMCCKITKLIGKSKYGLLLPFGVTGCIDINKGKHKTGSFTPKVGNVVQCKVVEVSKRAGETYCFMSLYGVKKLENKDDPVEENNSENEAEAADASENEKMDTVETGKEDVVEMDDTIETEINDNQSENELKESSDSEEEIPIIISEKYNKLENLTTVYKRIHQSDDEEEQEEIDDTEEKYEQTPAKKIKLNNVEKELMIRNAEKRIKAGEYIKNPVNEAENELLLFNYPNDANSWIKVMRFYLDNVKSVDKARSIAERAMKTLQPRDVESRFKVMKEYIELEITELVANKDDVHFDNHVNRFRKIFERGLAQKPRFVYLHVCEKLMSEKLFDLGEDIAKRFIKEFHLDSLAWFQLVSVRFIQKKFLAVKDTLINAERCLKAEDFRDLTIRVAQSEIEKGDPDRGVLSLVDLFQKKPKNICLKNRIIAIFEKNNLSQHIPKIEAIAQN